MKSVCHGFHYDGFFPVRDHPVELGNRIFFIEWRIRDLDFCKQRTHLFHSCALSQQPQRQFKLRNIFFCSIGYGFSVHSVSHKVQTGHAEPFFIYRIVIKRIVIRNMCHADHGIMMLHLTKETEMERIIPGCDCNLLPVRKFVIQIPSKIKVFCFIDCCCTHRGSSFFIIPYISSILTPL